MYTYAGDTAVDGYTAQKITVEVHAHIVSPPRDTVYMQAPVLTRLEDGVLFRHRTPVMSELFDWDTLIWYGAVPGDQWQVLQPDDYFCDRRMVVTDTGHVEVGGLSLRYVQTDYPDEYGEVYYSPLFMERIGCVYGTFLEECGLPVLQPDTILRCYQDVDLFYSVPNAPPCDLVAGTGAEPGREAVALWPNPGADLMHVEANAAGKMEVRVLDAAGRAVLAGSSPNGSLGLSSTGLPPGIYWVEVRSATGRQTVKWAKE
jgi:hypothetical protein